LSQGITGYLMEMEHFSCSRRKSWRPRVERLARPLLDSDRASKIGKVRFNLQLQLTNANYTFPVVGNSGNITINYLELNTNITTTTR